MKNEKPTILVIFGISGDLAKRYLLPALEEIGKANMLPDKFEIVGVTRQKNSKFFHMDLENSSDYERLNNYLLKIEKNFVKSSQRLFYMSVPPEACKNIIEFIGKSSLIKHVENKILLEKPFGSDLKSAQELIKHTNKYFLESQVYRIDHYMSKKGVQDMLTSRRSNPIFKNKWNKDFIESIEIIISEKIGIEGRIRFYEQTGALRDMVQNHLLQLTALTLMDLPRKGEDVTILRQNALHDLNVVCDITKNECAMRGQYEGYRKEVGNPRSMTETFVSINIRSSNPKWSDVPITLTTGKALKEKSTAINICYRNDKNIYNLFSENSNAYEQVLYNAINSDHSFFTSSNEILETWRILDAIQQTWKENASNLIIYKKGSEIHQVLNTK